MEVRQLKTFQMVATTLSFSQTANMLNYAQSTVTAQIQSLEEELGVPLFNRLGRRITLTEAGERLCDYAARLIELEEQTRINVPLNNRPMGVITFGAPETLLTYRLPRVLRAYRDRYPQVQVIVKPYLYRDLYTAVRDGLLDIAFLLEESVNSSVICVETLAGETLQLVAAPDYPLAACDYVPVTQLEDHPLLLTEPGCCYRHAFEHTLNSHGVKSGAHMAFYSVEALKQCAIAGLGVAVLPQVSVQKEIDTGQLVTLNWEGIDQPFYTQMLYHRERWLSPAMVALIELVREMMPAQREPVLK